MGVAGVLSGFVPRKLGDNCTSSLDRSSNSVLPSQISASMISVRERTGQKVATGF